MGAVLLHQPGELPHGGLILEIHVEVDVVPAGQQLLKGEQPQPAGTQPQRGQLLQVFPLSGPAPSVIRSRDSSWNTTRVPQAAVRTSISRYR